MPCQDLKLNQPKNQSTSKLHKPFYPNYGSSQGPKELGKPIITGNTN